MREWPIVKLWYTKHKGRTIEWIIDNDVTYFCWMVKTFQNVTPAQAEYFKKRWHKELADKVIQDVQPYEWQKGDPDDLYMELCETQNLEETLNKYRNNVKCLELF